MWHVANAVRWKDSGLANEETDVLRALLGCPASHDFFRGCAGWDVLDADLASLFVPTVPNTFCTHRVQHRVDVVFLSTS